MIVSEFEDLLGNMFYWLLRDDFQMVSFVWFMGYGFHELENPQHQRSDADMFVIQALSALVDEL